MVYYVNKKDIIKKDFGEILTVSVDRVSDLEAELFVFFAVFARTVFAHGSPSGAHGTATISLRHLHQTNE